MKAFEKPKASGVKIIMNKEELKFLENEITNLRKELTKRNDAYVFQLIKILDQLNFSDEKKIKTLSEVVPKLLEAQKSGKTAKQLLGTVVEYVSTLDITPVVAKNKNPWLMLLDNFLLMLGLLSAMNALMMFLTKKNNQTSTNGIVTLIVMSIIGGAVFLLMYHLFYKYDRPGVSQEKKPRWWVSGIILLGAVLLWILLMSLTTLLPAKFNPIFPSTFIALIAVLSLASWRFIHKYFNIESSFMPRTNDIGNKK